MRPTLAPAAIAFLLAGCTSLGCLGGNAQTEVAWHVEDVVARTPSLAWGDAPSLPFTFGLAGLPAPGATLWAVTHDPVRGDVSGGATVLAQDDASAVVRGWVEDPPSRADLHGLLENATTADAATREAWVEAFFVPTVEALPEGGERHIHQLVIPHDQLRLDAWWAEQAPARAASDHGTTGDVQHFTGRDTAWSFVLGKATVPRDGVREGTFTLRADGLASLHVGRSVPDGEARELARAWAGPLGIEVPSDAAVQRTCSA